MRAKAIFLLFTILMVLSCEKNTYENSGTITEKDSRKCMCCGGYIVEINETQYHFEKAELPDEFTFDDNQMPLKIEPDYKLKNDDCSNSGINWITVSKIREVK